MGFLKDTVIAITGTLPHTTKEIQGWVARNGGSFSPNIAKHVTHLLASKEAYKSRDEAVQQAMSLGIQILSYDWFDDSLQARRKLGTTRYLWEVLRKERRVSKQLKRAGPQADAITFRKGCKEIKDLMGTGTCDTVATRKPRKSRSFFFSSASSPSTTCVPFVSAKEDLLRRRSERATAQEEAEAALVKEVEHEDASNATVGTTSNTSKPEPASTPHSSPSTQTKITHWKDAYHYYKDVTGFEYKICLLRNDFSCNGVAKYYIGLLESHTKPHVYWSIVHYQPAKKSIPTPKDEDDDNNGNDKDNSPEENKTLNTGEASSPPAPPENEPTPEATRLTSLITPPAPNPDVPYTGELCPRNSPFVTAVLTFRHAFQDLTLLAWEDRFSSRASQIQLARAQHLNYEPFMYCRPKLGMPIGLFPQARGVFEHGSSGGSSGSKKEKDGKEEGYIRGSLAFPLFERGLDENGRVGVVVVRERERAREEQERLERIQKEEEKRKRAERRGSWRGRDGIWGAGS
ncbi:uncharacterized protein yc1106_05474 [Curvularia clavata]|uniref:BRCT domain-containing protein n=1 Tax=Curvularia clavata TaxID=95742 RepID=A0A9Q8ZAK3_CURCL|nr:uncharacterized protein yc1106_05474 [Curvularia clavata]